MLTARFLAVVVFAALAPVGWAQPGAVSGTVTAGEGRPLAGAHVAVAGTAQGAAADAQGRFTIVAVAPGRVRLVATAVGFASQTQVVDVSPGDTATVALVLAEQAIEPGEVVVTARETLTGRGGLSVPGTAHYLSPAHLARLGTLDVHRALRDVPGVQLQEEDGYGLRPNIGLRGSGSERSSRITLMEDGVLMAPAPYAAPAAYYFPSMGRMDGLEVRTGASQVRYGPQTTGGALNLLALDVPTGPDVRAEVLAGQNGRRTARLRAGTSAPRVAALGGRGAGVVVQALADGADGFKTLAGSGVPDDRLGTGFRRTDLFGRLRLTSRPEAAVYQTLTLTAGRADEGSDETYLGLTADDFASAPFTRYAASQMDRMETGHTSLRVRHVALLSDRVDLTTTAYRNAFARNWYKLDTASDGLADDNGTDRAVSIASILDAPATYADELAVLRGGPGGALRVKANNRTYLSRGVQSVLGWRIGRARDGALVEAGVRLHADAADRFQWVDTYAMERGAMTRTAEGTPGSDSNRIDDARAASGFVQAEIAWGPLALTPGLRHERVTLRRRDYGKTDPERTGTALQTTTNTVGAWIPGLAAALRLADGVSVFGGLHRGYAPPDATNETRPESSRNVELGVRLHALAVAAEAVVYENAYSNLLGSDLAAAGGAGTGDAFNGGAARVRGAEATLEADLARAAGVAGWRVPARLALTVAQGRFGSSFVSGFEGWGTVAEGDALPYLPARTLGASVGVERGPVSVALGASAVSAMRDAPGQGPIPDAERLAAHVVLDASATVAVHARASVFARALNLTDATYVAARRPAGLRPGLPRTLALGVRAHF